MDKQLTLVRLCHLGRVDFHAFDRAVLWSDRGSRDHIVAARDAAERRAAEDLEAQRFVILQMLAGGHQREFELLVEIVLDDQRAVVESIPAVDLPLLQARRRCERRSGQERRSGKCQSEYRLHSPVIL